MDKKLRIAVINSERCKPKKCERQCKTECPVVKMGKLCVVVSKKDKTATISEELCNGCGICTKKCPFDAIKIINLPISLDKETIHRYGQNGFKLHRLPTPKQGQVLGLIGKNGTGKSTALKILAGKLEPNLGNYLKELNQKSKYSTENNSNLIMSYFKGTELQNYFDALMKKNFKTAIKPQYVDIIPKFTKGTVRKFLDSKNERNMLEKIIKNLDLEPLLDKNISILSGGELQRFAIAVVSLQNVDCYMFDEPSSYLDIKQRLRAAEVIRSIVEDDSKKYVICVEHDIALLDYLCDTICMLYGIPSAYGMFISQVLKRLSNSIVPILKQYIRKKK